MKREREARCEFCGCDNDDEVCERCGSVLCSECKEDAQPGLCIFCKGIPLEVKLRRRDKVKCVNCEEMFLEESCIQCPGRKCESWYCNNCNQEDFNGTAIWTVDGKEYCNECQDEKSRCCGTWILHKCDPENCVLVTEGQDTGKKHKEKGLCCFVSGKEPCRYCININTDNNNDDDEYDVNMETDGWGPIVVKAGDETVMVAYSARRCNWSVDNKRCVDRVLNGDASFLLEAYQSAGRGFGISTNEESECELFVLKHGYDTLSMKCSNKPISLVVGDGRPVRFTHKENGHTTINMIPAPCVFQITRKTEYEYLRVEEDAFEKVFLPLCPDQTKNTQQKADWLWENREVIKTKIPKDYLSKFETWCKPHIFWQKK